MQPVEIRPGIFWVGLDDRSTDLFEGLWKITDEGVSYNAYLINDEKKALIDLSKEAFSPDFISQIAQLINPAELDYIIINHMEPDHSGAFKALREVCPKATIMGMPKAINMLHDFYGLTDNTERLKDGQTLELGAHTLQFFYTPFVHWPETMMTYDVTEKILFSCDAFGSYGTLDGAIFDDGCANLAFYEQEALRYYSNIVAAFSKSVLAAINKLAGLPIEVVAPSHGLIWRKDPARIISLYAQWAGYFNAPAERAITLLYGSMYRNTERIMAAVLQGIASEAVPVKTYNVAKTDVSYILPALWQNQGVIVGAPTYEGGMFPPMMDVLMMAERKRVTKRITAYFGSYAWSGGAKAEYEQMAQKLGWQTVTLLDFLGSGNEATLERAYSLGASVAQAVQASMAER